MYTDMHLHLQDIPDAQMCKSILTLAEQLNTGQFVCNATRPEDWLAVEKSAAEDPRVVPFFGVHPWYAGQLPSNWYETLESFLKRNPASGVGEAGLDKSRGVDLARQTEVLHRQIELAGRLKRPVALHCVQAWSGVLNILKRSLPAKTRFMIHSYQGSREMLREFLALGGYISFSWKSLQRDIEESIALMRAVPLDRLLLETDFPYTEPGRIGADVHDEKYFETLQGVYNLAVRAKGIEEETLEKAVWNNGTAFLSGTPAR